MRVTIIPADGFVSVDGVGYDHLDLAFLDPSVHAVQWYGDEGEVEIKDGRGRVVQNVVIDSLDAYQAAVDKWAAADQARLLRLEQRYAEQQAQAETLSEVEQ